MKTSFLVGGALFASMLAPLVTPIAQAAPAPTYISKKEGFAIYLPGKPVAQSRPMAMPGMGQSTVNFISVSKAPLAFIVIPIKLPGTPSRAQQSKFLEGVQQGFTMTATAKLLSSKSISLQGTPGREILVKVGPNLMRARFFVKGNRSYQIVAISPQNGAAKYNAQVGQVLDSFRILN